MSAVAQFDRLVELAESLNYRVRYENLGGVGGGACEFGGQKILFIDLSLSLLDQIEQMRLALGRDVTLPVDLPPAIRLDLALPGENFQPG